MKAGTPYIVEGTCTQFNEPSNKLTMKIHALQYDTHMLTQSERQLSPNAITMHTWDQDP